MQRQPRRGLYVAAASACVIIALLLATWARVDGAEAERFAAPGPPTAGSRMNANGSELACVHVARQIEENGPACGLTWDALFGRNGVPAEVRKFLVLGDARESALGGAEFRQETVLSRPWWLMHERSPADKKTGRGPLRPVSYAMSVHLRLQPGKHFDRRSNVLLYGAKEEDSSPALWVPAGVSVGSMVTLDFVHVADDGTPEVLRLAVPVRQGGEGDGWFQLGVVVQDGRTIVPYVDGEEMPQQARTLPPGRRLMWGAPEEAKELKASFVGDGLSEYMQSAGVLMRNLFFVPLPVPGRPDVDAAKLMMMLAGLSWEAMYGRLKDSRGRAAAAERDAERCAVATKATPPPAPRPTQQPAPPQPWAQAQAQAQARGPAVPIQPLKAIAALAQVSAPSPTRAASK